MIPRGSAKAPIFVSFATEGQHYKIALLLNRVHFSIDSLPVLTISPTVDRRLTGLTGDWGVGGGGGEREDERVSLCLRVPMRPWVDPRG